MLTDHSLSMGEFTIPTIGRSNPHHPFKLFTAAYQFHLELCALKEIWTIYTIHNGRVKVKIIIIT